MLGFVHGQWFREDSDTPYFGEHRWVATAFDFADPNNHLLYSVAARASLSAWRQATDAKRWEFSEAAFRFPAFLAGLLAVWAWGNLVRRALPDLPHLCWGLMGVLAVHPWFIRYISEGRGYAFLLLGLPLLLGCALRAMQEDRLRSWIGFGFWQAFLLVSWPGIGPALILLNLLLLFRRLRGVALMRTPRFWVGQAMTLVFALPQMLPAATQLATTDFEISFAPMNAKHGGNLVSQLATGTVWWPKWADFTLTPEFLPLGKQPLLVQASSLLLITLMILGVARSAWYCGKQRSPTPQFLRDCTVAFLLALVGLLAYGHLAEKMIFAWYFVWLTPFVWWMALLGAHSVIENLRWPPQLLIGLFLAAFAAHSWPQLSRLRAFPIQPMRESVLVMRKTTGLSPDRRTVLTAHINQMATIYDPFGYEVTDLATTDPLDPGLIDLIRRAQTEGKPLYLNVGLPRTMPLNYPDLAPWIEGKGQFELIQTLRGQELEIDHQVWRLKGPK